jgi:tRNA(Ile)-lysidine synthase
VTLQPDQANQMSRQNSSLIRSVRATIRRHSLFSPGERVVVAVSGGIDSMVLLDLLFSLDDYRLKLVVAHLNHLLRGEESEQDEEFVRESAGRYGIPCLVDRVDVRTLARSKKQSLEEAGREARHRFLEAVVRQQGAEAAALAHHADDQAETVLLRLLRGSGAAGLAGMSPRSGWKVRPLLDATRGQITGYAAARGIAFRDDSSNTDRRFLRNRVRHDLMPVLAAYNPAIARTLAATAAILAADDDVLTGRAEQRFDLLATVSVGEILFPVAELLHDPDAVRFRLYRRAIRELKGDLRSISCRHLLDVDRLLLHEDPSCSVTLPRSLRAGRVYDSLRFSLESAPGTCDGVRIDGSGSYPVCGGELVVAPAVPPFDPSSLLPTEMLVDLDAAPFPWTVRTFQDGDRMIPFGMTGSRKLKDILIDAKIPRHLRRSLPIICAADGTTLAVTGVRRSALAPVTGATGRAVLVTFRHPA